MHLSKAAAIAGAAASVAVGAAGGLWLTNAFEGRPPEAVVEQAGSVPPDGTAVEVSEAFVTEPAPDTALEAPDAPVRPVAAPSAVRRPPARPGPSRSHEPSAATTSRGPAASEVERDSPPAATVAPIVPAVIEPAALPDPIPPVTVPREPELQELVISADSVIGLQMETALSSETEKVEDEVVARIVRDVRVGDQVAVPANSKVYGEVTLVERGGKLRERARLGVRFTSIVLADGTHVPISTAPIYREGQSPGRESATKIGGGAIGGAIIGGILGGAKGAAIGGSIGAGAGSAVVLAGDRNAATLSPGSPVTVRLDGPATVVVSQ